MYRLQVDPSVAQDKLAVIRHEQFVGSIPKRWHVSPGRNIRPQSICWLFVWAAIPNPNWGEQLKVLFNEFMPFSFDEFDRLVGKALAESLRYKQDDEEVRRILTERLGSRTFDGPSSLELDRITTAKLDDGYFSPVDLRDERERRLREIVERRGQPEFRNKLIAAYGSKCALTGCDAIPALEAAHIVPYCGLESNHVTNGLLLRCDIHTLFDLELLGIDPADLSVALSKTLRDTAYGDLQGRRLTLPANEAARPNLDALTKRWDKFKEL